MVKRLTALSFAVVLVIWLGIPTLAQEGSKKEEAKETPAQEKAEKKKGEDRWEGVISRSNKDKSSFTVRQRSSGAEKTVKYDSSTKFTESEHHGKPKAIDADQIKDGDRIIALGKWEKGGAVLDATSISKRLTQH